MVINMVNFLNTVNMGRLEKTRAVTQTARRPKVPGMELKDKPEFFGAGQPGYMVPNIQQRKGENLENKVQKKYKERNVAPWKWKVAAEGKLSAYF